MRAIIAIIILIAICFITPEVYAFPQDGIVINIPSRTLDLYKDGKVIKTYPVGVGRSSFQTPTGSFKIIRKVKNPSWENPYKPVGVSRIKSGKSNPLGTRWIGFKEDPKGEYGIHGTDRPSSVGKYSSHGCVRMYIKDAEHLFDRVSMDTPVLVTYDTARIVVKNSSLLLKTYPDTYKKGKSGIEVLKELISKMPEDIVWDDKKAQKTLSSPPGDFVKIGSIVSNEG